VCVYISSGLLRDSIERLSAAYRELYIPYSATSVV
jgi:hypothetical protein